jgi:hypothetical protein
MKPTTKSFNGSPIPAVEGKEGETASTILGTQTEKTCQHPFCGCIGAKGYMCTVAGPCDPHDEHGRHFTVNYIRNWKKPGEQLCCKTLISPIGTRPFQYRRSCTTLIDAETAQAARGIRGAAAAIQGTIFADIEPFDPKKAVTDLVGS